MGTYSCGGSAGDVVYSLAAIKDIASQQGQQNYCLNRKCNPHWRLPDHIYESLKTLIEVQPYIDKCDITDGVKGIDIDGFRRNWKFGLNLSDMISEFLKVPHTHRWEPWLWVDKKRVASVVMHRSPRYHTHDFPWDLILNKYGSQAVFVGSTWEHADFCQRFGPVSYCYTPNYLELAEVINGADVFIGNQSSPASIAQGLRKPMIQETVPRDSWAWNCHVERPGMWHDASELLPLPLLIARAHSLLTSDRLDMLRALATDAPDGDFCELGVCQGGAAWLLKRTRPEKTIWLYDTFNGLPESIPGHEAGAYAVSYGRVTDFIGLDSKTKIFAGKWPLTLNREARDARYSLVHIDCDIVSTATEAISFYSQRMVPGGKIVIDDWPTLLADAVNNAGFSDRIYQTVPEQGVLAF